MEDSLSPDPLANVLVYLALAFRELLDSDHTNLLGYVAKIFSMVIYARAVEGKNIDTTYLTRYGRITRNEDKDTS